MAVNRFKPHIYVIPEDDANRQIAVGFEKNIRVAPRKMQILPVAGGWEKAIGKLMEEYLPLLRSNVHTRVVALIDCDNHSNRIVEAIQKIPSELRDRVFVVGTLNEPETLKSKVALHYITNRSVILWQMNVTEGSSDCGGMNSSVIFGTKSGVRCTLCTQSFLPAIDRTK